MVSSQKVAEAPLPWMKSTGNAVVWAAGQHMHGQARRPDHLGGDPR